MIYKISLMVLENKIMKLKYLINSISIMKSISVILI